MRLIAWVRQIHAAGGGKRLHHGDGVVCRLSSEKRRERKELFVLHRKVNIELVMFKTDPPTRATHQGAAPPVATVR